MIEPKIRPDAPNTQPGDVGNGRVLVIDESTQKFNGLIYHKSKTSGRYLGTVKCKTLTLHIEVWSFHNGRPPKDHIVHHAHRNPDGSFDKNENNIEHLRLMTNAEHTVYHFERRACFDRICVWCNQPFQTKYPGKKYCSDACRQDSRRLYKRMKYRSSYSPKSTTTAEILTLETKSSVETTSGSSEWRMEIRECPQCGALFKVDKYSEAIVCSNPDCVSKAVRMELTRKRIMKNKLERNGGINLLTNKKLGVKIRCLLINGEPWFVGRDVAKALGYKDTASAIQDHVEPEDKGVGVLPTPGGKQKFILINEPGLYNLINDSKLPTAKAIKYWIYHTVLPRLRQLSMYQLVQPPEAPALPSPALTAEPIDTIDITPDQ